MYGGVYTHGHECLQGHVCMGVTWGLLPAPTVLLVTSSAPPGVWRSMAPLVV